MELLLNERSREKAKSGQMPLEQFPFTYEQYLISSALGGKLDVIIPKKV